MFNFGQFRKSSIGAGTEFLNSLSFNVIDIQSDATDSSEVSFRDKAIVLKGESKFNNSLNYYLRLKIKKQTTIQNITVRLRNAESTLYQYVNEYMIPVSKAGEDYVIIDLVIAPNSSYDRVELILQRTLEDYREEARQIVLDSIATFVGSFYNIINAIFNQTGQALTKIGIQGPSGLLMCINGQEIRIGPSGIYEINNDYRVLFIGFAILPEEKDSDKTYFILDYQY